MKAKELRHWIRRPITTRIYVYTRYGFGEDSGFLFPIAKADADAWVDSLDPEEKVIANVEVGGNYAEVYIGQV